VLVEDIPLNDVSTIDEAGVESAAPATPARVEPQVATLASETPLERTRQFTWGIVVSGAVVVLALTALWWRKIRREQG